MLEFQKAFRFNFNEAGASTAEYKNVANQKQALRDAPADSGIASASTSDELKAQWKTDILGKAYSIFIN